MKKLVSSLGEKILLSVLMIVLIVLVIFFGVVFFSDNPEGIVTHLGVSKKEFAKYEALKFLGIGMGGVLLAMQAVIANRRAKAMEKQAKAQVDSVEVQNEAVREQAKANQDTERGRRQGRLKDAIDHLGDDSESVRLGSAHELFQLAQDTPDFRVTVLSILCAHIRQTTGKDEYQKKYKSKPSEEIQSLLTLLFVQKHEVFKNLDINLWGSWLNGVNLRRARLEGAILTGAHLRSADFEDARLQGVDLTEASLHGARLRHASLHGARLRHASLHGANLVGVSLHGANFEEASLCQANLVGASLHGANLAEAILYGANLIVASLHGTNLVGASLHGANLRNASLHGVSSHDLLDDGSFAGSIRARIDKETDLSGVILAGGLSPEKMNSLVKGSSDGTVNRLRQKLEAHINQPVSHELPQNSGAITGRYTAEEAEQWIAEYEKAMSEVPEEGNN